MFKSRRSSAPIVSPLDPPPASTFQHQQNQPGRPYPNSQHPSHPSQQQQQQQRMPSNGSIPRPNGPGDDLQRIGTNGTMDSGSVSSKSDKRRSGFFGLGGKKDKNKEKEREREKEERVADQRSSFSVDRPRYVQPVGPEHQRNPEPGFSLSPQMNDRFPRPQPSHSPLAQQEFYRQGSPREQGQPSPPIHPSQSPTGRPGEVGSQRVVSTPQSGARNEFAGSVPQGMPKSQSMGFNDRQHTGGNVPETHPYRGFLNAQQDKPSVSNQQGQNGNVPRSNSMPLDKLNAPSARSPPPIEKETMRGSPSLDKIGASETGVGIQPWMKQFDGIVELIGLQPQKTYVASPPELEMILARTSAGGQPKQGQPGSASNDWDSVWLQLSGISLSMWSMKETRAAAAKGEKVPPTYFNITDSSLELLAPLPPPPHRPDSHPHHFVFSLNTAGSNRLLFSCPSERDLAKWSLGLRLAAWERARLEEIYTGHLIKAGGREPKSEIVRGRMEGWVRVRVMGGTDWKRLWVVLSTPNAPEEKEDDKKSRRRSFFGLGDKDKEVVQEPNTGVSMASFYLEPRTSKNKTSIAVLTITNISQAYAVFPERLEVMSQSNLMKVVGRIGGELVSIEGRLRDSGWALIMPETAEAGSGTPPTQSPLANMMRWVTGFHDVFGLYGRPERYNWNPKDPKSLFFAYPQGQHRGRLFLDIDEALASDFRLANLPAMRQQFCKIVEKRLNSPAEPYRSEKDSQTTPRADGNYRLPPLQFGDSSPALSSHESGQPRSLTPITERTDIASRTNSTKTASSNFFMNDRKVSDGQTSKQGSGGSSRHIQGASGEERLAPISDSTETFGQYTEEPASDTLPEATPVTNESATAPTTWSRSSAATPTLDNTPTVSPGEKYQPVFPLPPVGHADRVVSPDVQQSSPNQTPPELPAKSSRATDEAPKTAPLALATAIPAAVTSPRPSQAGQSPAVSEKPVVSPQPRHPFPDTSSPSRNNTLRDEPAAIYLMNMVEDQPTPEQEIRPDRSSNAIADSRLAPAVAPPRKSPSPERPRIITSFDQRSNNEPLCRKPSGARAPPPKKGSTHSSRTLESISDNASPPQQSTTLEAESQPHRARLPSSATMSDLPDEAANFMAYAEQPSPEKKPVPPPRIASPPRVEEELRSSFAPSRAAAERKAKAEQAALDKMTARNVPGGGKRTAGTDRGAWSGSEDEEEPEPEEEQSPVAPKRPQQVHQNPSSESGQAPVHRVLSQTRALPPVPRPNGEDINNGSQFRDSQYSQYPQPPPHQREYSAFPAAPDRPRSHSPAAPQRNAPAPAAPQPPAQRQTLWNANFAADHGMEQNRSGKFVDLEEPSVQLTKAFAPHGLLQAGMQDKEDRSAKKQEELARETGSSLINVPAKPPPPQIGLLGAVAAHEKDRKNPGGIGATLTDREREKRLAEERQREIEKLQRQQMEHMSKFGDPNMSQQPGYGQFGYGMPSNMGMMGMPPMGFNPYQSGYNPYAQQQAMMAAQMAYQQAMMMSQAGSQVGGPSHGSPDRPSSPASGLGAQSPAPGMAPYPNFYPQQYPFMGGMGMPWSPAQSPVPMMPHMTGGSWLQPPGPMGGGGHANGSEDGSRSRVPSMYSDSGHNNAPVN